MFREQYIDAGTIRVGQRKLIQFPYDSDNVSYISILQGCGCSAVTLDRNNKVVNMEYVPGDIPEHLRQAGSYDSVKSYDINFGFDDGSVSRYTLAFRAKIIA